MLALATGRKVLHLIVATPQVLRVEPGAIFRMVALL